MIPFNKPYLVGKEVHYIFKAIYDNGHISGDGEFTKQCHSFFEQKYGFKKCLLTTSCTDALEMAAILIDIKPGDEVIVPAYTFVSTANAFVLRGAKIVFADSGEDNPNIDVGEIEKLITKKTKAIVPVHYAGIACDMDRIMEIANKHNVYIIEDAAQAIDSYYKGIPLGSFGHLAAFSFHETKNIHAGEGGMLVINDDVFNERAEIIWEKGTNRAAFHRGEISKYEWVDIGSSFLPSDIIAAFLLAQLENIELIQNRRKEIWNHYYSGLRKLEEQEYLILPKKPDFATNNAHNFYILCKNSNEKNKLLNYLKSNNIYAVFHYIPLNESKYYNQENHILRNANKFGNQLIRLPLFFELTDQQINYIISCLDTFFNNNLNA